MTLAQQRCFTHEWREAAVRCPGCQRYFCRECATEHDGRLLCLQCLAAAAVARANTAPARAVVAWTAAALAGLVVAWVVFFYLGALLARTAFDFHTG